MTRHTESFATTQDMAAKYRISADTVRTKVSSGQWPCDRVGRLYRFSPTQQDEIAQIVSGKTDEYDPQRIREALRKLSA